MDGTTASDLVEINRMKYVVLKWQLLRHSLNNEHIVVQSDRHIK
jgi:hypothetical protein